MRPARLRFALLAAALVTVAVSPAADEPEDQVRRTVQKYFDAYAAKNLDQLMGFWAEKAPGYDARKKGTTRIFAESGEIKLDKLTVVEVKADAKEARVRVRVELYGQNKATGKPHADLGTLNRIFYLRREGTEWKVWQYIIAEDELAEALLGAADKDARAALYKANADLVPGPGLTYAANRLTKDGFDRNRPAAAQKANALALETAERSRDNDAMGAAHSWLGVLESERGDYTAARAAYEKALGFYREAKRPANHAGVLNNLGKLCGDTGRYAEAFEFYERSLALKREVGDQKELGDTLNNVGNVYWQTAQYRDALRCYEEALALGRAVKDSAGTARALINIGLVYGPTGRHGDELKVLHEALKIARETENRAVEALALQNLGGAYRAVGGMVEARRYFEDSLAIKRELGDRRGQIFALTGIGNAHAEDHEFDEALKGYREALALARELRSPSQEAPLLTNIGSVLEKI